MRVGIGLPAAVPGLDGAVLGPWAAQSERVGFTSLGVIDRLIYDNLDPLVALAAAAARTGRIELLTTVLNVGYRRNPTVLAKQIASVDQLSTRRLTVGLALGGWPEDYAASEAPLSGRGATFDATLVAMRKVWRGKVSGSSGPMPALPEGHPGLLLGGLVAASFDRVAAHADGWVAPSFGMAALTSGMAAVHRAWKKAGRRGEPRIVVERYFSLGDAADEIADHYLRHYYGSDYFPDVRADALTSPEQIRDELRRLDAAGCQHPPGTSRGAEAPPLHRINLNNPMAIFAGSPPRFTRSRVTYEAYVVSRTSTRPQVDSARGTYPRIGVSVESPLGVPCLARCSQSIRTSWRVHPLRNP